jgi:hypothetical protein
MRSVEEIDLDVLSERLSAFFDHRPPVGYLRGKGVLRDAVIRLLGCSALEAEELVDTMESRGFLRYGGDPSAAAEAATPWAIDTERDE